MVKYKVILRSIDVFAFDISADSQLEAESKAMKKAKKVPHDRYEIVDVQYKNKDGFWVRSDKPWRLGF